MVAVAVAVAVAVVVVVVVVVALLLILQVKKGTRRVGWVARGSELRPAVPDGCLGAGGPGCGAWGPAEPDGRAARSSFSNRDQLGSVPDGWHADGGSELGAYADPREVAELAFG